MWLRRVFKYLTKHLDRLRDNKSLVRYIVSGVAALLTDYLSFLTLYYLFGTGLKIAVPFGLTTGLIVSFLMNKLWAFGKKPSADHHHRSRVQVFMFLGLFGFNTLFTYYFVNILLVISVPAAVGKIGAVAVTVVWNYFAYKKVIFKLSDSGSI